MQLMWSRQIKNQSPVRASLLASIIIVLAILSIGIVAAQEATAEPPGPITVTATSPKQILVGQSGILVVAGTNFRPTTTVTLVGSGALAVTLVNASEIRAAIPSTLA